MNLPTAGKMTTTASGVKTKRASSTCEYKDAEQDMNTFITWNIELPGTAIFQTAQRTPELNSITLTS
jgi:hypothetical protein